MPDVNLRWLGLKAYEPIWRQMQSYAATRDANSPDEIWCLEHPPVYTQGAAGKEEHVLRRNAIPVVAVDRGGQVTYHGPGQLMVYPLLDLKRHSLSIRDLVTALESAVVLTVATYGIHAIAKREAPGVYVEGKKLASIGLRVRRQSSYHGVSINVAMDLSPFDDINPCGYAGLAVTDLSQLGAVMTPRDFAIQMIPFLFNTLRLSLPVTWQA